MHVRRSVEEQLQEPRTWRLGVVSDTHGLLRPEVAEALRGCDLILHAGDVGNPEVLDDLRAIAPVVAVRGNNDHGDWASVLPETLMVQLGGLLVYVIHDRARLELPPEEEGIAVVISGHSHKPSLETEHNVLFLNPGSAGPRRFQLPIGLGRVTIRDGTFDAELVEIAV